MYVKEFRADRRFQMEALKRLLRYQTYLRTLLIVEVSILFPLYFYTAYINFQKYQIIGILWIVYPFIILLVPLIPHLTPKTYRTHLKGIYINGNLYRWKNFSSYFTDDSFLYLRWKVGRWEVVCLVLPKEFEDVVKEFVRFKSSGGVK